MKNRTLLMLGALLLMGAPCAQEDHDDHHEECPPVAAADAGNEVPVADAGSTRPDAGAPPAEDPVPTMGEHELGLLHNAALLVVQRKIESGELVETDNLSTNLGLYGNAIATWICDMGYDCTTTQRVNGEVIKELVKAVQAIPEGGTLADGLRAHLPTMTDLPDWVAEDLVAAADSFEPGDTAVEDSRAAFAAVGMGRGDHNGGNHGRIIRSVSKGSWNFWTRPNQGDEDDVVKKEWVYADCAGAAAGGQIGGLFGPWAGLAGGLIGGAAASLAVR